jgi:hypothetical protein
MASENNTTRVVSFPLGIGLASTCTRFNCTCSVDDPSKCFTYGSGRTEMDKMLRENAMKNMNTAPIDPTKLIASGAGVEATSPSATQKLMNIFGVAMKE